MGARTDASTGQLIDDGASVAADTTPDGRALMHVKVYSPFRTYFNGSALSLSAKDLTGPFDVLPHHHKFISLLVPCEISLDTPAGPQKIKIAGGILHVRGDQVSVLLDV